MAVNSKNQHYVWRHYLSAWTVGNSFYCYSHKRAKFFRTQPSVVANERYFYELFRLTAGDLRFLDAFISRASDERLREINRGFVEMTQVPFKIRERLDRVRLELRPELEKELRRAERNLNEQYYSSIETVAKPLLDSLKREDDSFYTNLHSCTNFTYFLAIQYFRTAKMRNVLTQFGSNIPDHDPGRTAGIMSHLAATNVASGLFRERGDYHILFLRSPSAGTPFISADQPVLNMRDPNTSDDLELFYPVSPSLAIFLTKSKTSQKARVASPQEMEFYNYKLYCHSEDQIYSNDRAYLDALIKLPKTGIID